MSKKAYVRPGKMMSVVGIIGGFGLLIFGFSSFGGDDSGGFMLLWTLGLIFIIGYNVYNLLSKKASSVATEEIELDLPESAHTVEEKLRSLERMKKGQLITAKEYQRKRKEIMQQKW